MSSQKLANWQAGWLAGLLGWMNEQMSFRQNGECWLRRKAAELLSASPRTRQPGVNLDCGAPC